MPLDFPAGATGFRCLAQNGGSGPSTELCAPRKDCTFSFLSVPHPEFFIFGNEWRHGLLATIWRGDKPMAEKRTIRAKDIVNDMRAGMSDQELMGKYRLSVKGLESIFKKLEESGTLKRSDLYGRLPSFDDTVNLGSARKLPRNYCALKLVIHEADNPVNQGEIFDASEKGVGVQGMESTQGKTQNLVIDGGDVDDLGAISFRAVCRWSRRDEEGVFLSGFEIVTISDSDMAKLKELIRGATLGF